MTNKIIPAIDKQKKSRSHARSRHSEPLCTSRLKLRYRLLALLVSLLLIASLFAGLLASDLPKQKAAQATSTAKASATATAATDSRNQDYVKHELIYSNLNAPDELYAVNYFEAKKDCNVTDYGNYSETVSLKPEKKLETSQADNLTTVKFPLQKGEFFYYQAKLHKMALPWKIEYSYQLDGQQMTATEIAGKSGHFTLKMKISADKSVDSSFFDSYILQFTLALPLNSFHNIQAEQAQISLAADKTNIVFLKLPKQEAEYTVTADANNIHIPSAMLTALPLTFKLDGSSLLQKQLNGLGQLESGINQLHQAAGALSSGYSRLNQGIEELAGGGRKLASGSEQLFDGASAFTDGLQRYSDGLTQYFAGVKRMDGGMQQVKQALSSDKLQAQLAFLEDLKEYLDKASPDMQKIDLQKLEQQMDLLLQSLDKILSLFKQNQELLLQLSKIKLPDINIDALRQQISHLEALIDQIEKLLPATANLVPRRSLPPESAVNDKDDTKLPQTAAQTEKAAPSPSEKRAMPPEPHSSPAAAAAEKAPVKTPTILPVSGSIGLPFAGRYLLTALPNPQPANPAGNIRQKLAELRQGLHSLASQLNDIAALTQHIKDLQKLLNGGTASNPAEIIAKISETEEHLAQAKELLHKFNQKNQGKKELQLSELSQAIDQIKQLIAGLQELADGSGKLAANADLLGEKKGELTSGSAKLTAGAGQLAAGSDKLADGLERLADGSEEYQTGLQAYTAGFAKLAQATSGMSLKAQKQMEKMIAEFLGQNFRPHSFIAEKNAPQTVTQFIMVYPGISLPDEKTDAPVDEPQAKFWDKLKALFRPAAND